MNVYFLNEEEGEKIGEIYADEVSKYRYDTDSFQTTPDSALKHISYRMGMSFREVHEEFEVRREFLRNLANQPISDANEFCRAVASFGRTTSEI